MSYFPTRWTIPEFSVSSSEKKGLAGTLISSCSKGKYSLDGRPPPSEIKPIKNYNYNVNSCGRKWILPGVLKYFIAAFNTEGYCPHKQSLQIASEAEFSPSAQYTLRSIGLNPHPIHQRHIYIPMYNTTREPTIPSLCSWLSIVLIAHEITKVKSI